MFLSLWKIGNSILRFVCYGVHRSWHSCLTEIENRTVSIVVFYLIENFCFYARSILVVSKGSFLKEVCVLLSICKDRMLLGNLNSKHISLPIFDYDINDKIAVFTGESFKLMLLNEHIMSMIAEDDSMFWWELVITWTNPFIIFS